MYKYIQGVQQKIISNFEGQYPTLSFNKNHQKYTNITPYNVCNFDNYQFLTGLLGRNY